MTAVATLTGALSNRMTVWRLQARMVKVVLSTCWTWHDRVPQGAFARLELLEGKLSRAVLRGLGGSNPARLPGASGHWRPYRDGYEGRNRMNDLVSSGTTP